MPTYSAINIPLLCLGSSLWNLGMFRWLNDCFELIYYSWNTCFAFPDGDSGVCSLEQNN